MAVREFDASHEQYEEELTRTAHIIDPSDEQCDRILQNVLQKAGVPDNANYTDAVENVKRLSSMKAVYSITSLLRSKAGAAVVAACLVLVVGAVYLSGQQGSNIIIEDDMVPLGQAPISGITYSVEQPVPDSVYSETLAEGDYPDLEAYQLDDNVRLYFVGNVSDIDWGSAYGIDATGREVPPKAVNPEEHYVLFDLPDSDLAIYISDVAGHRIKMMVRVSESE